MIKIANRVAALPSLRIFDVVRAKNSWESAHPGQSIISFLVGDSPYREPKSVQVALRSRIESSHKYGAVAGEPKVLEAVAQDLESKGYKDFDPAKNICITNGVIDGLGKACLALLNPGDHAAIPVPYYFVYPGSVALAGGECIFIETKYENGFKLTPQDLRKRLTQGTRLLIFNSPLNPAGSIYSFKEMYALSAVFADYPNVAVLCDDVYDKFTYKDGYYNLFSVAPQLKDRILTFNSISKSYGLSGLRAGWVGGPEKVIAAIKKIKTFSQFSTNTIAEEAIYAALINPENTQEEIGCNFEELKGLRYLMMTELRRMGIKMVDCDGGMFLFPQVPEYLDFSNLEIEGKAEMSRGEMFARWLMRFGVTVAPGIDMGMPDYFRMSFAMDKKLINLGLERINNALWTAKHN